MSKMKKWAILVLAILLICSMSIAVLASCDKHEHAYTKSNHDGNQHWMECPEDGEKDPDSVENHKFVGGKCECGYEQPHEHTYTKWKSDDEQHWKVCPDDNTEDPATRASHNFVNGACECGKQVGSASGTVKVYKDGAFETDYTGVTATLNDSKVEIGANGAITLPKLFVGNTYELKISKDGYTAYSEYIEAEKGVDHKINEGKDVVLQYRVFKLASGSQDANVDYSKMNDGQITLTGNGNIKLDTIEMYDTVAATVNFTFAKNWDKWEEATSNKHRSVYYVALYFENGQNIRVQLSINENRHFVLQEVPHDSIMTTGQGGWEDWHGEGYWCNDNVDVAQPVRDMYEENDNVMPYTIERNGAYVYIKALGISRTYVLPDAYKTQKAGIRIGIESDEAFVDTLQGAGFTYEIGELPKYTVKLNSNSDDFTGAAAALDKNEYLVGDTVKVTFTLPQDTSVAITCGGVTNNYYESGEVTFSGYKVGDITVQFDECMSVTKEIDVDETLNGKKITIWRNGIDPIELTVANGKISLDAVREGEYEATAELLGVLVKGSCTISADMTALDLSDMIGGTADINAITGEFVYQQKNDDSPSVNVVLAEGKSGDAYVSLKLSTDYAFSSIINKYEELHLGVWMTVGGAKHWIELHWRNWDARELGIHSDANHSAQNGKEILTDALWSPIFENDKYGDGAHNWAIKPYGEAFTEDGIYLVMKYNSATGNVDVLLAKSDSYVKVCTFEGMFEAEKELTAFGVGKTGTADWGFCSGNFKIDCQLKYGSTLLGVLGVEEGNITITNPDVEHGTVTVNGSQVGDAVSIKVTPADNCILKSLKINGKDVKGELDKDGNLSLGYYLLNTLTIEAEFVEHVDIVVSGIDPQPENGTVAVTGEKVGDIVEITFTPDVDGYLSALTVNGVNRLADVVSGKLNLGTYWTATLEITAVFTKEVSQDFNLTVEEKFNGVTLTLKRARQDDITATVEGGKLVFNGKPGEYTVEGEFLGVNLTETINIASNSTALDMSGFATGTANIDITTGSFKWHRYTKETVNLNVVSGTTGNQYVALKIKTADDLLNYLGKPTEIHFGISMKVGGEEHWVVLNIQSWEKNNWGFTSDKSDGYNGGDALKEALFDANDYWNGPYSFGTHGKAIIGDGLYMVLEYESATGNANVYLSDGSTYVKVYSDSGLFKADSALESFGVVAHGTDWNYENGSTDASGAGREYDFTLSLGATMNVAVGREVTEYVAPAESKA